ncbi:MAG TPA: universal stress protein [Arenibacter sp.]|nr:universal stress protein [Arenibacter sp.]
MKRIILPSDFSENADNAIRYAIQLFKEEECAFYLLHTYTPAIYQAEYILPSPGQIGLGDVYQVSSMERLEKLKEQMENDFKNPKHHFIPHSANNSLVSEIMETVEREKIDLVIMGTQGATEAKEILFGTNTVDLIRKANCPVIAVPSNYTYEPPKEILFPTDYEIAYGGGRLNVLLHLAKIYGSQVEVIYISPGYDLSEVQSKNKRELGSVLEEIPHLFHELPDQEVIRGIADFRSKKRMDLLVMVQNRHTFLERLFIDPVIEKAAFHLDIPFLVFPVHS